MPQVTQAQLTKFRWEVANFRQREKFNSFKELSATLQEGIDYRCSIIKRHSRVLITAIHGGLEPGTDEFATLLAGETLSLYCFKSLRDQHDPTTRIRSTRFDDPRCLELCACSTIVLSVHGCANYSYAPELLFVGGQGPRPAELRQHLRSKGFSVARDRLHPGQHPHNICNRGQSGGGLQLELQPALRHSPPKGKAVHLAKVIHEFLEQINGKSQATTSNR